MTNERYAVLVVIIMLGMCVPFAGAQTLSIQNASVLLPGDTAQVNLTLDEAPGGFSGYNITITLLDPAVGEITGVAFPGWADLTDNSSLPASSVWMKGFDSMAQFPAPSGPIPIGSLTLQGNEEGTTVLALAIIQFGDANGTPISPDILNGTFRVGEEEPPGSVTGLVNTTYLQDGITWVWTDPVSADFDHVMVYLDGVFQENVSAGIETFPATGLSSATAYTIATRTVGTSGLVNETWVNHTAWTKPVLPIAGFTANTTLGRVPLPVQFTDTSTGDAITGWSWTFGDGGESAAASPPYTYTTPGTYTVSLLVTSDYGSNTSTRTDYIRACGASPAAGFTANITIGQVPLPVQFTDTSTGDDITGWSWMFGDGATSTLQSPAHTYVTPGNYTVSLEVADDCGSNTSTRTGYIRVFGASPVADFIADPQTGGAPLAVQFYDTSAGSPTTWYWDFGDGATSTLQSPSHTYATHGVYTVSLTAGNSGGTNTVVKTNYITATQQIPGADFTADPTTGAVPLDVSFTDLSTGSPTLWSWDFGDGNTSDLQNPSHTYAAPGTYSVTLTASNTYGSDPVTKSDYITCGFSPQADFNVSTTSVYTNWYVEFYDLSTGNPTEYFWDFGDGSNATWSYPWHAYSQPGTYTVSLTVTNAFGSDTETKTDYIVVSPRPPEASFEAYPRDGTFPLTVTFYQWSYGGYYGNLTYAWDFGDGTTSDSPDYDVVHTYMQAGVYTVSLTVSADGLSDTLTRVNYIGNRSPPPPVAGFTATPLSGNAPLTVSFIDQSSGSPPLTWSWDLGDGSTSTEQNPVHQYLAPGSYNVTLTVTNAGGESTESRESYITVGAVAPLAADFSANTTTGTVPLIVQFTDTSTGNPGAWSWTFERGYSYPMIGDVRIIPPYGSATSAEKNPVISYPEPGNYSVSLTVSRTGETDTITKEDYIQVHPPAPQVDFGAYPREGPAPLEVEFWENVPFSYYYDEFLWDFGDGTNGTGYWLYHTYTEPGLYDVTLTVTSAYGTNSTTRADFINVTAPMPPVPDFVGAPLAGNAPLSVNFTDTSAGIVSSRSWDFGDGTTAWSNATQSIMHTYLLPGTYTVTLTAGNDGGQETLAKTAYVVVNPSGTPPRAFFSANPALGTAPLTVSFTDRSLGTPLAWLWSFGDGTSSTERNPVHTYTSPGIFTITLNVSNYGGTSSSSSFVWVRSSGVAPTSTPTPPPVTPGTAGRAPYAIFTMNTSFGYAPLHVQFTDRSLNNPGSWFWNFGDGTTSSLQNPGHTYTEAGTYTASLTVTNPQGASTISRRVLVR